GVWGRRAGVANGLLLLKLSDAWLGKDFRRWAACSMSQRSTADLPKHRVGADLGVRHRWVFDEHGDHALAVRGQLGERLAQRGVALRCAFTSSTTAIPACGSWMFSSRRPAHVREPPVCAPGAGPGGIHAGWWWRAGREARPDRAARQAGPPAAARRSARLCRHRRGPAGTGGRLTRPAGRTARRTRPPPAF